MNLQDALRQIMVEHDNIPSANLMPQLGELTGNVRKRKLLDDVYTLFYNGMNNSL